MGCLQYYWFSEKWLMSPIVVIFQTKPFFTSISSMITGERVSHHGVSLEFKLPKWWGDDKAHLSL